MAEAAERTPAPPPPSPPEPSRRERRPGRGRAARLRRGALQDLQAALRDIIGKMKVVGAPEKGGGRCLSLP